MPSLAGSLIGQRFYNGGWTAYSTSQSAYAGKTTAEYYPYILKVKTPAFVGRSDSITFKIGVTTGYGSNQELRYALCTSDANLNLYVNTANEVSDSNQLASGTYTFAGTNTGVTYHNLSISSDKLRPSTEYYLFLWGKGSASNWIIVWDINKGYHSVAVAYTEGLVQICDGSSFAPYQIYIYTSSGWALYQPYIYTSNGWVLYT